MDPTQFDDLTRALSAGSTRTPTRRSVLATLAAGVAALGGLVADTEARKRKRKCRGANKDKTFCPGAGCKDVTSDPAHCGICFRACAADQTCETGRCTGGAGPCVPQCAGAVCGADDGCGGRCFAGSCPDGQTCGGGGEPNVCGTGCTPSCDDKQCGSDGCNGSCGDCPDGQICRDNGTCIPQQGGGCDPACGFNQVCENDTCVPAPNRCSPGFVCSGFGGDPPACGNVAGAPDGTCGCVPSTEGNTVCINQTDSDGDFLQADQFVTCTTSQQCRDTVGFHFYCRKPLQNENGLFCGESVGRCWPECDNPSRAVQPERTGTRAKAHGKRARGTKRR